MRSERLIGLPVMHIDLGKRCGVVQGLILDPHNRRVAGLVVSMEGWRKRGLLPMDKVYAAGEQAVTIEDESAIIAADEETDLRALWQRKLELEGMPVLTVTGRGLGSVDAYEFNPDGSIDTLYLTRGTRRRRPRGRSTIPGSMVRSFGEDAVIVAPEAEEWIETDPAPDHSVQAVGFHVESVQVQENDPREPLTNRLKERLTQWGRRPEKKDQEAVSPERTPPEGD